MIKSPFTKKKSKIFCISFQRTGTTSTGDFFQKLGYKVAGYPSTSKNRWTHSYSIGDLEAIFNSNDFKTSQVFEDDPWWIGDFYKQLFHKFPKSKFVLLERDSNAWFKSMLAHSGGKNLGNSYRHSKIYRREREFYEKRKSYSLKDFNENASDEILSLEGMEEHYKYIYELRNNEVKAFFEKYGQERIFNCRLEDQEKWVKMAAFFGHNVDNDFDIHSNKS